MRHRTMTVAHRYLNIPVKGGAAQALSVPMRTGADKAVMRFWLHEEIVREFYVEYRSEAPDFWVYADLLMFNGEELRITLEGGGPGDLDALFQSDEPFGMENLYHEALRPQLHFSSKRGWLNDPNGLVWFAGVYHLFYQHNPYGWDWGNMHWGHAVSDDLMHWREMDIVLYPDAMGTMYSGSGVVDPENIAGFRTGPNPALVLMYTAAGDRSEWSKHKPFVQCLAYSNDAGISWKKYAGNPVMTQICAGNRDPRVLWYAPTGRWVMVLYLDGNTYSLFASHDLKRWEKQSEIELPGCSECPDLFELPIDGSRTRKKWVFWGGNGSYSIGSFDGTTFVPETAPRPAHQGEHSYAAQTWSNIPAGDGRVLQIAWARFDLPGMPFNRFMTLPCELTLHTTGEGVVLSTNPAREVEGLRERTIELNDATPKEIEIACEGIESMLLDASMRFAPGNEGVWTWTFYGVSLAYDVAKSMLCCMDCAAYLPPTNRLVEVRVLLDKVFIEVFGGDGRVYMPIGVFPDANAPVVKIDAPVGAHIDHWRTSQLRSIWDDADKA